MAELPTTASKTLEEELPKLSLEGYLIKHLGARDLAQESLRFLNLLRKDPDETDRQMARQGKVFSKTSLPKHTSGNSRKGSHKRFY